MNRSQIHECRNWKQGRAVSFLGMYVSNFRYSESMYCRLQKESTNTLMVFKFSSDITCLINSAIVLGKNLKSLPGDLFT